MDSLNRPVSDQPAIGPQTLQITAGIALDGTARVVVLIGLARLEFARDQLDAFTAGLHAMLANAEAAAAVVATIQERYGVGLDPSDALTAVAAWRSRRPAAPPRLIREARH